MVALPELKNKGKVQLGNPKSGCGHLWELFITIKSQFKCGKFTKVVLTRAGRLRVGDQVYKESFDCINNNNNNNNNNYNNYKN